MWPMERREFLKVLGGTMASVPFYLQDAFAEPTPFLWGKEEILFGPEAGFEEARAGIPLGIFASSSIESKEIIGGILGWNALAKELGRQDLFSITYNELEARIIVDPSIRNRVTAYPDYKGPFEKCVMELNIDVLRILSAEMPRVVAHELGHTLGFVDFIFKTTDLTRLVNPQRCDIPDKPILSIMAENSRWFGEHDSIMLQLAGYLNSSNPRG